MSETPFQIKQEKFEGPLELLLDLIEKEKLAISEISLAKVTDDYIQYVKSLETIDTEALAEFLVIAAHLMLVKSRAILPTLKLSTEEEESIEELEHRLQEYRRYRDLAKDLKKFETGHSIIATREQFLGMDPIFYPPKKLTAEFLRKIFAEFIASLPKIQKLTEERIKRIVSLEEKILHIRKLLQEAVERSFFEIVRSTKGKIEVIVSFLALLELAKQKFINLEQGEPFEDIKIKKVI